jgi:hypothetical protein
MKHIIKKLLREGLEESIKLQLSKDLRKIWDNTKLDDIFGKNVYRLYYKLDTGEQIQPTRKRPNIKMDIPKVTDFKKSVEDYLNNYDFDVVDLDKNIAKNNRTNQNIKITKILNKISPALNRKYKTYFDLVNNNDSGGKSGDLYVVVSRHPHDLASKSAKPRLSSCEDLRDYNGLSDNLKKLTTKRQVSNIHPGEGGVVPTMYAILDNWLIFYLIDDGDWNIEDPHARLLGDVFCGPDDLIASDSYGDVTGNAVDKTDFHEFKYNWVNEFSKKYTNKGENKGWSEWDDNKIVTYINNKSNSYTYNKFTTDLIMSLTNENKHLLDRVLSERLLKFIDDGIYGDKVLKELPIIKDKIKAEFNDTKNSILGMYNRFVNMDFNAMEPNIPADEYKKIAYSSIWGNVVKYSNELVLMWGYKETLKKFVSDKEFNELFENEWVKNIIDDHE